MFIRAKDAVSQRIFVLIKTVQTKYTQSKVHKPFHEWVALLRLMVVKFWCNVVEILKLMEYKSSGFLPDFEG